MVGGGTVTAAVVVGPDVLGPTEADSSLAECLVDTVVAVCVENSHVYKIERQSQTEAFEAFKVCMNVDDARRTHNLT